MNKLSDIIRASGATQKALADRVGISSAHMSEIASGLKTPSLPVALRIAEITGVPIETLIADERGAA